MDTQPPRMQGQCFLWSWARWATIFGGFQNFPIKLRGAAPTCICSYYKFVGGTLTSAPKLFSTWDLWLPKSILGLPHSLILSSPSHTWHITAQAPVMLHTEGNYWTRSSSVGQCLWTCATKFNRSHTTLLILQPLHGLYIDLASSLAMFTQMKIYQDDGMCLNGGVKPGT